MRFVKQSSIRASQRRVFGFHEQPEALTLLLPPWEIAKVIQAAKISEVGSEAVIEVSVLGLISLRWVARHTVYEPPHLFEDIQVKGPFRSWRHRHTVEAAGEYSILRDEIEYEPPLGFIGRLFGGPMVEKRLQKLFDYRHEVTRRWCENAK